MRGGGPCNAAGPGEAGGVGRGGNYIVLVDWTSPPQAEGVIQVNMRSAHSTRLNRYNIYPGPLPPHIQTTKAIARPQATPHFPYKGGGHIIRDR